MCSHGRFRKALPSSSATFKRARRRSRCEDQKAGGCAIFQYADLTDERQCAAVVDAAVKKFGKLNGLVNNAGWFPRAVSKKPQPSFGKK